MRLIAIQGCAPACLTTAPRHTHGGLRMQAAGAIAGQRAALIGRVLPCLLALAEANGSSAVSLPSIQPLVHIERYMPIISRDTPG